MNAKSYLCIGVMTGNSLDAVDVVATCFENDKIRDICGHSKPIPSQIADGFRQLKQRVAKDNGNIQKVVRDFPADFDQLHDAYITLIAETIRELLAKSGLKASEINAVGFHGQTCAHCPPSVVRRKDSGQIYTLQIGSGQMLADLITIPVVYDFRSDDLMNLGEAAPFAPMHNRHLAETLREQGIFPVAFCNGGNTGNLSIVAETAHGTLTTVGWDTGPFNHFIDYLARTEKNQPCDFNGEIGKTGQINQDLLRSLFNTSVSTKDNQNFLLQAPPKSSDPAWYRIIPALTDKKLPFEDRIRTAEFFSAYIFVYNFKYLPPHIPQPAHFLTFGGGWKNPLVNSDFISLLHGKTEVLPEHQPIFAQLKNNQAVVAASDDYGYNGQFMEARIFADMAKCKLTGEPFSIPETTGCKTPTVGGIIAYPGGSDNRRWSRAALGWATS